MNRFNRTVIIAMIAAGALLAGPATADHGKHYGHYDGYGVRVFPGDRGWRHGHDDHRYYQHRRAPRPFHRRHWRRGHRYLNGPYRYYPGPVVVRPRHYHSGYVDHFHRNRPLLQVLVDIDRYIHCPDHGGYFLRDDLLYY